METKSIEDYHISEYDLIIFDCDGTLVDSEPISNGVLADMIREQGAQVSNEEILERFAGTSFADIVTYLEKNLGIAVQIDFEREFRRRAKVC
jgi:beta-phosphoglucomutase-like phosphatase (HAD superfamily)